MKKLILTAFLMLSMSIYSQEYSRITIEPSIGITKIQDITSFRFANYNLGGRYMFNNKFGVRLAATYTDNIENYTSITFQGVANVGRMLNFEDFTDKYTILLGIGGDFTYLHKINNPKIFRPNTNFHLMASIDNLYKINKDVALKASLNVVTGINDIQQSDLYTTNSIGINLGISYTLGKKDHIDWYVKEIEPIVIDSTKTIIEKPVINNYITKESDCNCSQNEYVFFDNDKSEIKETGLNAIAKIVNYLKANAEKEVILIGYASNTANTTAKYDNSLSEKRAQTIFEKLMELGISAGRINLEFRGKDIDKKETSFDFARRVELLIR
ncbi:OmpA family protein [Aureibaculum sp. 2210JD6-5]|uniref:OmpA family protein n=1 Tax=Aureibaculum sp. 2210JD6-5 TaxID=3103957 RepID=UPI002AAED456|nr:OmpA family protein [Aureibaculum sp. 2210JD6-5]MDY7395075.1 OmpA family protein [Aureibaculum sp. 2210JD6-5]